MDQASEKTESASEMLQKELRRIQSLIEEVACKQDQLFQQQEKKIEDLFEIHHQPENGQRFRAQSTGTSAASPAISLPSFTSGFTLFEENSPKPTYDVREEGHFHIGKDIRDDAAPSVSSTSGAATAEGSRNGSKVATSEAAPTTENSQGSIIAQRNSSSFVAEEALRFEKWFIAKCDDAEQQIHEICRQFRKRAKSQSTTVEKIVTSVPFAIVTSLIIIMNAIFVGVVTDNEQDRMTVRFNNQSPEVDHPPPHWHKWIDLMFCVFWLVEILMRAVVEKSYFVVGPAKYWNLFDGFVLIQYVVEVSITFGNNSLMTGWFIRRWRSVRVVRILRSCHPLRFLFMSIAFSFKPFLWVFVFVGLCLYAFAVPIQQSVALHLSKAEGGIIDSNGNDALQALNPYFTDFYYTIMALFMSISGGADWGEMYWILNDISFQIATVYVLFIFIMIFCICNIITGIFVDAATTLVKTDPDMVSQAEKKENFKLERQLRGIFREIDTDNTGYLTLKEFLQVVDNEPRAQAVLSILDIADPKQLLSFLDKDGSGSVDIQEFVDGCMTWKGLAGRVQVAELTKQTKKLYHQSTASLKELKSTIRAIQDLLHQSHNPVTQQRYTEDRGKPVEGFICTPPHLAAPVAKFSDTESI